MNKKLIIKSHMEVTRVIKNNLPVILLKGLVLLPFGESRIELNNDITKKIIDISKLYHDNEILIVTPINDLEETPDTGDLPRIGVIAKITSRIDLPNGNTRIVLKGERRVKVLSYVNYSNEKDILESIVVTIKDEEYHEVEETALLRKLISELNRYISLNPLISNSIINQIKGIVDLDKLTDTISNFLTLNFEKKLSLMLDTSRISRAKRLITEINIELEILELENKIEQNLTHNLDEMQKEMILKEKIRAIKEELGELDTKTEYINKIKEEIESKNIPNHIQERIKRELQRYENMTDNSPEIGVITTYIDYLISIPFGIKTNDENNLITIEESLNKSHFGLTEVKKRIIEYIAVKTNNENASSPIICLVGPPGVGKTTLAKSIAESLNKNFVKISLGGINDPAELIGHKKTYIGSSPGKIINAIIKAKSENPVILLDEIDKLSRDYKGDPASVLLDLLDAGSNKEFTDAYIEEPIDLSKVTWIITANDASLIPYVLLDRLEIINIESYLNHEKIKIAENYLIPNAKEKNGLYNIDIPSDTLEKIINDYTKESGVRELDRLINKIFRKVIVKEKLDKENSGNNIIDIKNIKEYLGEEKYLKETNTQERIGYMKGIAYTPYGGEVLEVEVTSYKGKTEFITSGCLGSVLEESIKVSLSYIKSNLKRFNLTMEDLSSTIHLNFREGSIPKDGPSAGILITTTILSYLLKSPVKKNISMTGEITLLGDIIPIGGLREKSMAAIKEGITTIYLSKKNKREVSLLDKEIKNKINFILVDNYIEIFKSIFERGDKNDKIKKNTTN